MRQREDFGRVDEGAGPLAGAVEGDEDEDEEGDQAEVRVRAGRDVEAHAGGEQREAHEGEGGEQEGAPAPEVDGPEGGEGEDEHGLRAWSVREISTGGWGSVYHPKAPGDEKRNGLAGAGLDEDGGGVEGHDVDCAWDSELVSLRLIG